MIENASVREAINKGDYLCDDFGIQLTRRCNFGICPHCINGKPEEIDISKEVIEKVFFDIRNINSIILLGGEVSLNAEGLEYMLTAIEKYKVSFNSLRMASNGREFKKDFYDILSRLGNLSSNKDSNPVTINISSDDYHVAVYEELGFDVKLLEENINRMRKTYPNLIFHYPWVTGKQDIYEMGSAKKLKKEHPEFKDVVFKESPYEDMVFTLNQINNDIKLQTFNIDAKGNVIPRVIDYAGGDMNNYGNILEEPLKEILISKGSLRRITCKDEAAITIRDAESSILHK